MSKNVVPMMHVPDVRATVDWYESIGFRVVATYGNESDGLSFAIVAFGKGVNVDEDGKTVGLTFIQDGDQNELKKII